MPADGTFPVEEIGEYLAQQPFSFRDPASDPPLYLLCGNAGATQFSRQQVLTKPEEAYPPVALIRVSADAVHVSHRALADAHAQARAFVEWMNSTYACRVFDEAGREFTDKTLLYR